MILCTSYVNIFIFFLLQTACCWELGVASLLCQWGQSSLDSSIHGSMKGPSTWQFRAMPAILVHWFPIPFFHTMWYASRLLKMKMTDSKKLILSSTWCSTISYDSTMSNILSASNSLHVWCKQAKRILLDLSTCCGDFLNMKLTHR